MDKLRIGWLTALVVGATAAAPMSGMAAQRHADPTADEVLRRTAEVYAAMRSLRADFVQRIENPLLGDVTVSRGTLFQRRPDYFLMRFSDPEGDVIVGDGRYFWIYYPSINADQVIRAPLSATGATGGMNLFSYFFGDPAERYNATLEGTDEVDGHETYVLTLVPTGAAAYETLEVWIDSGDHLIRRLEITEPNRLVRRIELSEITVNPDLPDSLFQFTPPEGARIIRRG